MQTNIEQIKHTLSVGLVLAASSELLIRTSVLAMESAGLQFKGEARRAMTQLIDSTRKVQFWYDRLNEVIVGNDSESAEIFDNMLYNSRRLAQMAMMYYNVFAVENKSACEDIEQAFHVLENLSLKSTANHFTQDYIMQFEPKV